MPKKETLEQAIARMHREGYSENQIRGQVNRWRRASRPPPPRPAPPPTMPGDLAVAALGVGPKPPRRAPVNTQTVVPARKVSEPPTSYKPYYKGQKPSRFEPQAGPFGVLPDAPPGGVGRVHYGAPIYARPAPGPVGDEASQLNPLQLQQAQEAGVQLPTAGRVVRQAAQVAGTVLGEAGGGPLAKHIIGQVGRGQVARAGLNAAFFAPVLRGPRAVLEATRALRGGEDAVTALRAARASMKEPGPILQALAKEPNLSHPLRDELDQQMKQAGYTARQRKAELKAGDVMARDIAHQHGVPPNEGWKLLLAEQTPEQRTTAEQVLARRYPNSSLQSESVTMPNAARLKKVAFNGVDTSVFRQHDIGGFLKAIPAYLQRGAAYRKWYEDSGKAILAYANGDRQLADKFAQIVAIYSASRNPRENINLAVEALREYQRTGKITVAAVAKDKKQGLDQADKAMMVMRGEDWGGRKTNRFYANMLKWIDPVKYQHTFPGGEVTNDIWMARLFGLKTEVPTPREYDQMTKIQQNIADELGWSPEEIQAALWVPAKADAGRTVTGPGGKKIRAPLADEEAGIDFAKALQQEAVTIPIEAAPGARAAPELKAAYDQLPPERQQSYMREKLAGVHDFLRDASVFGRVESEGLGVFKNETNPNFTLSIPMPVGRLLKPGGGKTPVSWATPTAKRYMTDLISVIGDALDQDAMAWFRPIYRRDPPTKQNGMWLQLSRPLTDEETGQLGERLGQKLGGYVGTPPAAGNDLYVLNYSGAKNPHFHDQVVATLAEITRGGEDLHVDPVLFRFDGEYRTRSRYTSGQLHKQQAETRQTGRPDVREAARRLRERSSEIDQRYLGREAQAAAADEAQAVTHGVPGLDVPVPGDVFPAHWTDTGSGPGLTAVYDDARSWLSDVAWSNMDPEDMHALPDSVVANAIDKYYDGGMEQFISDSLYVDPTLPIVEQAAKPLPEAFQLERPIYDNGSTLGDRHYTEQAKDWQRKLLDEFGDPVSSARFVTGAVPLQNPAVEAAIRDPYAARELTTGGLTAQFLRPRSKISRGVIKWIDEASVALDRSPLVHSLPGVRNVTSTQRVVKAAGRAQRMDVERRYAKMAGAIRTLSKVKESSAADVAHFWYAQLPEAYRGANGLEAVAELQRSHLKELVDGTIAARLDAHEAELRAAQREAETGGEAMQLQSEIGKLERYRQDMPFQVQDTTASIGILEKLIENPPVADPAVIDAMRLMAEDRKRILVEGQRLDEEKAAGREGLLTRELGLEPDGSEVYVGHRLAEPEPQGTYTPSSGGVGRVKSPKGAGTRNELVLARNGRLRASTRVNYEDWTSSQVFEQANRARDDLALLGPRWTGGNVPADSVLINKKGETIPKAWRSDELSQFTDDAVDREEIRKKADDILKGFIAFTPDEQRRMAEEVERLSIEAGKPIGDIRIVKRAHVDRYYAQFRQTGSRGGVAKTYDHVIDGVATSIIFARIGYIPKNMIQNLVMAVPHQGAFLIPNGIRAGQVLNDPELRDLIRGQVSASGATAGMSKEMTYRKVQHKLTHYVTSVADDPARISAFLHEAAAEGVIPRAGFTLGPKDREALIALLRNPRKEKQLFDITRRAVESMGDFTRMTPSQARHVRRFLIIPGWLVAGSRYPFHFAATHPVRSALIAYGLMGEPGAPKELQFNQPITHYLHGDKYLVGFDSRWGRLRVASLDPISTPEQLAVAAVGSVRGKKSPFDYATPTAFDFASPVVALGANVAQGKVNLTSFKGIEKAVLSPLVPDYSLLRDVVYRDLIKHQPSGSPHYPDDNTWWRRLERETGVMPIRVEDVVPRKTRYHKPRDTGTPGLGGPGGSAPGFGVGSSQAPGLGSSAQAPGLG